MSIKSAVSLLASEEGTPRGECAGRHPKFASRPVDLAPEGPWWQLTPPSDHPQE
jgi:hypothetical protein